MNVIAAHVLPGGVIHVGAHLGEEVESYLQHGYQPILLVEANPQTFEILKERYGRRPEVKIFQYAITDFNGKTSLRIHTSRSGNTESSSLLRLKKFKEIVKTLNNTATVEVPAIRLDDLLISQNLPPSDYSVLNVDVQGAELQVLRGAPKILAGLRAVLTEVNLLELYEGCALEKEVLNFLQLNGFEPVDALYHELYDENSRFPAWGEVLSVKRSALKLPNALDE
jgi:FkbM family methyltransferase